MAIRVETELVGQSEARLVRFTNESELGDALRLLLAPVRSTQFIDEAVPEFLALMDRANGERARSVIPYIEMLLGIHGLTYLPPGKELYDDGFIGYLSARGKVTGYIHSPSKA